MSQENRGSASLLVVGGGITGLSAAWEGCRAGLDVTLLEATGRFGGLIRTSDIELPDHSVLTVDEAADAFLARVPDAVGLVHELGLEDQLTEPSTGRAMVRTGEGLRWFPEDSVLGVPLDADALEATGLLDGEGMAAVRAEPPGDPGSVRADTSVGALLRARFGDQLVDRVVGPLVGGISAGDVDAMSLRATTPQLADAAAAPGRLSDVLRSSRNPVPDAPVFHALRGGTQVLVDELVDQLRYRGAELRTGETVEELVLQDLQDQRVVLTTPAASAASMLRSVSPATSELLDRIRTASVVLVTLVFDRTDPAVDSCVERAASGFLVPRDAGLFLSAVSWGSNKWAHWDDGEHLVVRASAGHSRDRRVEHMDDEEVVAAILDDLRSTSGLSARPLATRVSRWTDGFHQYDVGHLELVERIEESLRRDTDDRVRVAGAAYRGVGIPACIRQGRSAVSVARNPLRPRSR